MKEQYSYPNGGYEFTVVRKEDIIECLDANVKDKEVILEIIKTLEIDATNFLNQGRWTGIPFLGSIKFKEGALMNKSEEQKELITEAYTTLNKNEYVLFRRTLAKENDKAIRNSRYFDWVVSLSAHKNVKLYNKLCKNYSESTAKVILYSLYQITDMTTYDNC